MILLEEYFSFVHNHLKQITDLTQDDKRLRLLVNTDGINNELVKVAIKI
jgi:hypothetical protein